MSWIGTRILARQGGPAASGPATIDRRALLLGGAAGLVASAAGAAPYRPAGLYKPQEAAAGITTRTLVAPPTLRSLSVGVTANPRTWPLINRAISLQGADLAVTTAPPGTLFLRQLRDGEFDVSEMSTSFSMIASLTGDRRFIPIPVFTSRYFFHSTMLVRKGAGIRGPADLKGRRVGVPEYMMTGALWTRGVLKDEFGVAPEDIEWWAERMPAASQQNAIGKAIPANVRVKQIPTDKSVASMMLDGGLDAAMMYIWSNSPTPEARSTVNLYDHPAIATLFPDPMAENARYYRKTGIYHINHCAVVKRSTTDRCPELPGFALRLFEAANELADIDREEATEYYGDAGLLDLAARARLERSMTPYGLAANRKTLETLARYSHEQGFTPKLIDMDAFFGAATG